MQTNQKNLIKQILNFLILDSTEKVDKVLSWKKLEFLAARCKIYSMALSSMAAAVEDFAKQMNDLQDKMLNEMMPSQYKK